MVNIYTGQLVKVLWYGVYSQNFPVVNGVKQGGILSPVLFCVYIDELLLALRQTNVGCFMGSWFVGVLAYADDIVLMAPILPLQCVECWPCVMTLRLIST